MFGADKIIFECDTELDHYSVVERIYEGRPARVLFSGRAYAAQSGVGLDDGPDLLFDYNQRFLELVSGVYPKKVLLIGGGAFTLPMALVQALPDVQVDVVELDPGLTKIATDYFGFKPSERLKVINDDGRHYLETTTKTYDMILIDAFSHLTIPESLMTHQAVQKMHDHLTKNGLVAMNVIAAYQGRLAEAIRSIVATYETAFKTVNLFPAAHGLSTWLPQNLILVAQKGRDQNLNNYLRHEPLAKL